MTALPKAVEVKVVAAGDIARAGDRVRQLAELIGFTRGEIEEIVLAVSELASNLVRHAGGGLISLSTLQAGERAGVQIESADNGPGITDIERALTDGFSTAGGLGNGLGTVNRLMDRLDFHQPTARGLRIVCQRWVRPRSKHSFRRLDCGAATRACRSAQENGDAFVIKQWADQALLGVIDGLGHGPSAHKAAHAARSYVEHHFDQPFRDLFRGVERACRATRGVVMGLARVELTRSVAIISVVGNVEVRLLGISPPPRIAIRRGILGSHAPEVVAEENPWGPGAVLIMHSDGVQARWHARDYADLSAEAPALVARRLLQTFGKAEDDATVLVAKNSAS